MSISPTRSTARLRQLTISLLVLCAVSASWAKKPSTGKAWRMLRWEMTEAAATSALKRAGVAFTRRSLHKTGTRYLRFEHQGRRGTAYFSARGRLSQVLLTAPETASNSAATASLAWLTRRFGKAAKTRRLSSRRWRNRHTTVTAVVARSENSCSLRQEIVSDPDPRRRGASKQFARLRGWSTLTWGMPPRSVLAALAKAGIKAREVVHRRMAPAPNAPIARASSPAKPHDVTVVFRHRKTKGRASFAQGKLAQVTLRSDCVGAKAPLAAAISRYGPPHSLQDTSVWRFEDRQTSAELTSEFTLPKSRWSLNETYTPVR